MTTLLARLLAGAIFLPSLATAQTMAFDCPAPGTVFTYDSGTKTVAGSRSGMDCDMQTEGGAAFKLRALLIQNPSPDGADTSAFIAALRPERLWPLEVGRKVEASFSAGGARWEYSLAVVRYERRTGPAGAQIDTFVVEMNESGPKGQRSVSRWWISPADKYAIRFDYSDGEGRANRAVVTSVSR